MPRVKGCFIFHTWTKWGKVERQDGHSYSYLNPEQKGVPFTKFIQERSCEVCGIVQRRKVTI